MPHSPSRHRYEIAANHQTFFSSSKSTIPRSTQMIATKEVFPIRCEVAVHIRPCLSPAESFLLNVANGAVCFQFDERRSASVRNRSRIGIGQVPFVGRDLTDVEVLIRYFEKTWKPKCWTRSYRFLLSGAPLKDSRRAPFNWTCSSPPSPVSILRSLSPIKPPGP